MCLGMGEGEGGHPLDVHIQTDESPFQGRYSNRAETICHLIWTHLNLEMRQKSYWGVESNIALHSRLTIPEIAAFAHGTFNMKSHSPRHSHSILLSFAWLNETLWFIELARRFVEWAVYMVQCVSECSTLCTCVLPTTLYEKRASEKPTSKVISKLNFCFSFTLNRRRAHALKKRAPERKKK